MTAEQGRAGEEPSRVEYKNPPIVEAVCQFDFVPPLAWSPIIPGMFFERIRAEYPENPEIQQRVQANVEFGADAAGQTQFTVGHGDQRLIYKNESRDRLIVLSPSSLSANSLPPYEGWPALSARFRSMLERTREVLRGAQVGAVTVRYINRIVVPVTEEATPECWFNVPYRVVGGSSSSLDSVFQRVEVTLPDGISKGVRTFASVDLQEGDVGGRPFLLDLEFRRTLAEGTTIDDALAVATELKVLENAEFEACITDKTRELFR